MMLPKVGLHGGVKFRRGLDDEGNLPIYLHVVLPAVDRLARRENIHTGGKALFHQAFGQYAGNLGIRKCGEDETNCWHGENA